AELLAFIAAADDGHGFALDPHEYGKGVELGGGLRHGERILNTLAVLRAGAKKQKERTRASLRAKQSLFRKH
ncbi:hypothetical protein, partial [Mesorhizobium sp.]|uniref:hypothetical protein n=1 Tax=Mesorhizobium sp. TaxID=1871066 RepID=UPI00257E066A